MRYILQNTNEKIGCIVNDVASVNVDAKLLRNDGRQRDPDRPASTADLADTIELANGCACCSIADELFVSFENLLQLADKRGVPFDRCVALRVGRWWCRGRGCAGVPAVMVVVWGTRWSLNSRQQLICAVVWVPETPLHGGLLAARSVVD